MDNNDMMLYFKLIGRIQKTIANATDLRGALRDSLKLLTESIPSDMAIVWYADDSAEHLLRPFYWIGDRDITSRFHAPGSGSVASACQTQKAVRCLSYVPGSDPETEADFPGMAIRSMICVPFSVNDPEQCCIQLIRSDDEYTEETADTAEIMAGMLEIAIGDNENIRPEWHFDRVLLSARGITKSYRSGETETSVLRGIDLDIYEGEFLVVLGESGCGKSTFLNIVSGLDKADGGHFTFDGTEMSTASGEELTRYRRENIGFIFQNYNLMPNLTARQNLTLIGELVPNAMDAAEALGLVGLGDKKDHYPFQLSGGQQQRVSIARALVKRPRIIFADEPTAALDYATGIEVLTALESVRQSGTTLVMVTHNEEITRMADRVVRIRQGKVREITINRHRAAAKELVW